MRSSTSSSEARFVAALAMTFGVLLGVWELVLRQRASETVDFVIDRPPITSSTSGGEEWLIFGNCLMMTGVSPARLDQHLSHDRGRTIINIAAHEQSPIAFFEYLRRTAHYPDVVVANVSSWLNGTNFEQEGALVTQADPLGVGRGAVTGSRPSGDQAYRQMGEASTGGVQSRTEDALSAWTGKRLRVVGHRYHLFDWSLFFATLVTTADLDNALYQLNMQAWFRVKSSETDGRGFVGLHVAYRDDWSAGLERMAERSLQRLRLSRSLTSRYWSLLEDHVRHFEDHGTRVVIVRMPEHPRIRQFNDETYDVPLRLRQVEERTGAPVYDLSQLGPADGVRLFDAVHPDADAAEVITRKIGNWLDSKRITVGQAADRRRGVAE